jgi:hypothetical protein
MESTTTTTTTTITQTCGVHGIHFLECSEENCTKKQFCKLCQFNSKEDLQHSVDHHEWIKDTNQTEVETYRSKMKDYEGYADLNKIYMDSIEKAEKFSETFFEGLSQIKVLIIQQLRESVLDKYNDTTSGFEELVKTLTERLGNMNLSDKKCVDSIKRMKSDLEVKTMQLNNGEALAKMFTENFDLVTKRINNMKIKDLLEKKFNFCGKKSLMSCELSCGGNIVNLVRPMNRGSGSYWTVKTNEVIDGAFECRIRVKHINASSATSYWNYAVGIMKADSTRDSNYYDDSIVFQSNGYIANQFSGSGSHLQLFNQTWKGGDEVLIKREENNDVYFAMNDDTNYKMAFPNISGKYRVIFGFGSSMNEGEFELEELYIK